MMMMMITEEKQKATKVSDFIRHIKYKKLYASDRFKSIKSARVAKTFKIKCQLEEDGETESKGGR